MSLIQGIITEDFITVGTDNKNNLVKLNKQVMVACTGDADDNKKLFDGFCTYGEGVLAAADGVENVTYADMVSLLTERFESMKEDQNSSYKVNSFVCGYNGAELEITLFALGMDEIPDGIVKAHKPSKMPYQAVTLGKTAYSHYLHTVIHANYHDEKELNALRYKYILQDVFAEAAKLDADVNADVFVEKIRKKDML